MALMYIILRDIDVKIINYIIINISNFINRLHIMFTTPTGGWK